MLNLKSFHLFIRQSQIRQSFHPSILILKSQNSSIFPSVNPKSFNLSILQSFHPSIPNLKIPNPKPFNLSILQSQISKSQSLKISNPSILNLKISKSQNPKSQIFPSFNLSILQSQISKSQILSPKSYLLQSQILILIPKDYVVKLKAIKKGRSNWSGLTYNKHIEMLIP
jgi:hypothetical protein